MASRRLDISSLLCDDNPTPFSPLEALVHAATEEKRRLDGFRHPPTIAHLISPDPDPRHIKKRRYSLSPTSDDIIRERDKMLVGELGYGRVDPSIPSFTPRRPGSHSRKPVAVADLLSPPPPVPAARSPPGRRSPPGSQIGRAKAARKSDEYQHTSSFPRPPPNIHQQDAHEWFLHQFDQVPSPSTRLKPPHPPSPPLTAAVALEQEFIKEQEPQAQMDLDVDLAVTELVQTMEGDDNDLKPPTIEVDVEDELLSLIDDRPPPSTTTRRPPPPPPPALPATTTNNAKPAPSLTEPRHVSPIPMGIPPASAVRHPSTKPTSERGSMPPPASTTAGKKGAEHAGSVVPTPTTSTAPKKKKEAKPKTKATPAAASASTSVPAKPKPKPTAKSKKVADAHLATASISRPTKAAPLKKTAPSGSRSRSTSVMPDTVKAEKQEEEEDSDGLAADDKLYCVCKTKYDEDRFMIACDRCDEWYHTQCVHMPDLEVDLVDQFICPPCVEKDPHLNLRTTYKSRCLYGLRHPDPSSTKACHKAARGAFSKYCSDECGVKYMQSRVDSWSKKGGKPEKLWESVKHAEKREGVVVCTIQSDDTCSKMEVDVKDLTLPPPPPKRVVQPPLKSKLARETERLDGLLDSVVKLREEIKKGMEAVIWRERLLQLASERAELVGQCGWDQRLCLDDEEWADVGAGVLESYEHVKAESTKEDGVDGEMEADGSEEQWWCPGQKVCDRHQGWQTVRYKDVSKEKEKKEEALMKLTTREREIRKRIEDMLDPQDTNNANTTTAKETTAHAPLKASNTKAVNGHPKSKGATSAADNLKKGKKRKAPAA